MLQRRSKKSRANELTYPFTLLFILISVVLLLDARGSCSSLVPSSGALALTQIPLACGPSPFDKGDFQSRRASLLRIPCLPCQREVPPQRRWDSALVKKRSHSCVPSGSPILLFNLIPSGSPATLVQFPSLLDFPASSTQRNSICNSLPSPFAIFLKNSTDGL